MIKPDARFKTINEIQIEFFNKNGIKGAILDLDNTIIDTNGEILNDFENWLNNMKKNNIKFCIATNSLNKEKIDSISKKLEIPYVYGSCKPLKKGIKQAIQRIKLEPKCIAEIGDQLFTDVWVSNRMGLFSILTEPISKDRFKIDKLKRKIEKWYLARQK